MASQPVARGLVVVLLLSAAIGAACSPAKEPGAEPINEADSEVVGHAIGASIHFRAQFFQPALLLPPATAVAVASEVPSETATPEETATPAGTVTPLPTEMPTGTVTPIPSPSAFPTDSGTPTPTPTPGGNTTDVDADGVPAGATYAVDEAPSESAYGDGIASGTMTMTDADTSTADGAFSIALHLELDIAANAPFNWDRAGIVLDGTVRGAAASTSALTFQITSALQTAYDIEIDGATRILGESSVWDVAYTPDGAWKPGLPIVVGGLDLAGATFLALDDQQAATVVSTTVPLRVDPACRQLLVGGAVTLLWSSEGMNREIQVGWFGCNQAVVLYDETTITTE